MGMGWVWLRALILGTIMFIFIDMSEQLALVDVVGCQTYVWGLGGYRVSHIHYSHVEGCIILAHSDTPLLLAAFFTVGGDDVEG